MRRLQKLLATLGIGTLAATTYAAEPEFDVTPDKPQSFAYKINWFAVRAPDQASVLEALELGPGKPVNWASGLEAAYGYPAHRGKDRWAFVSPPVNGWVFVVGSSLPYPVMHTPDRHGGIGNKFDTLFSRLSSRFSEVQFFGSYRVVGFVAWARAHEGKPVRVFAFGDGDVYANIGAQSPEEAALGLPDLSDLPPSVASERIFEAADGPRLTRGAPVFGEYINDGILTTLRYQRSSPIPDEEDVLEVAARWSLNPKLLGDLDYPPGLGVAVQLPESARQ